MARHRLPLALIWPSALVVLVGVLAFFQYRWLGQVSESERDRMRATLNQRAHEFADDFDRETSRAYAALQFTADDVAEKDWESFAKRYDAWKESARYPQLIRNIFITPVPDSADPLMQFDPGARTFRPAEWPPELDPVRARLHTRTEQVTSPLPAGAIKFVALGGSPVISSVPAILIPVPEARTVTGGRGDTFTFRVGTAYVVLELDRDFMVQTMLPSLVARHFAIDDYRVVVTDQRAPDTAVYTRGVAAGGVIKPRDADVAVPFFTVRPDGIKEGLKDVLTTMKGQVGVGFMTSGPPAMLAPESSGRFSIVVQQDRTATEQMRVLQERTVSDLTRGMNVQYGSSAGGAWQIVLQHPAGSLEAAVAHARRRNLSLSFGVLAVLAAGVFLISINAERAQKLAAQQMDFVATVTHELRTPLAVIRSAAQNLSAGVVHVPDQAKRYGELIDTEGRRLTDMVEQVLTYAGLSDAKRSLTTTPTDIASVTKDVIESCRPLIDGETQARPAAFGAGSFAVVDTTIEEALPDVPLDEGAFRRALSNLIVNALKYGSGHEWIGVAVKTATSRGGKREVRVSVSDRGRGIDPADLSHIFDAFYRGEFAKEQQIHGNGLGLSLVKSIAEAHGGRVTVESTPGAGATFTLHFPA
jgi:signal transduction histidine kinase